GQRNLFGGDDDAADNTAPTVQSLPEMADWSHREKLAYEEEVIGVYLSSPPLTELAEQIARFSSFTTKDLHELEDGTEVVLGGMISAIKKAATKKPSRNGHTKYVNFDFEDPQGVVRCIMWPEEYARLGDKVQPE